MTTSTFTFALVALSVLFAAASAADSFDISAAEHNSYDCSSTCKSRSKAINDCAYRPNCEVKTCKSYNYRPQAKCVPKPSVSPTPSPSVTPSSSPSASPSVSPTPSSSPAPQIVCSNKCIVAYKARQECQYKPGCKVITCGRRGKYGPYLAKCAEDKVVCPNKCTYKWKANKECRNLTGCAVTDCYKNRYGKTLSKCGPAPKY